LITVDADGMLLRGAAAVSLLLFAAAATVSARQTAAKSLQGTNTSETSGPEIPSRFPQDALGAVFPATSSLLLSSPSAQTSCEALIEAATAIVSGAADAGALVAWCHCCCFAVAVAVSLLLLPFRCRCCCCHFINNSWFDQTELLCRRFR